MQPKEHAQRDPAITLRPIQPSDMPFLLQVYASTRDDELARTDWDDEQKRAFVTMQFEAQHAHYQTHYFDTSYDVILVDGTPVGRLYVARWKRELRIVDIALMPEFRSRGIGAVLVGRIQDEARRLGKSVTIHVEMFNPALRFYERLGFRVVEDKGVYLLMEWQPGAD